MKNINLCLITPNPADATSFYRAYGPFSALRKSIPGMNLISGVDKFDWSIMGMLDIVFLHRPMLEGHLKLVDMAKSMGVKVWLDLDDDLWSVPVDNPAHSFYKDEKVQKLCAKIYAMADVVTVSTNHLKSVMSPLNKNIVVVNNAINDHLFKPPILRPFKERPKLFNWRGSKTHVKDVFNYGKAFMDIQQKSIDKKWKWHWLGDNPWMITERFDDEQMIVSEAVDVIEYHKFIANLQPLFQIVPLVDNRFNRSKSNVAFIEATFSGALTIGPNWEEWAHPGVLNYDNVQGFQNCMSHAMDMGEEEFIKRLRESEEVISEKYVLSKINKKRIEVFESLQ